MSFAEVLPLVFVMVAGPQILSAIFLATSENWRRNSTAFVGGAALSISLVVGLAYALGVGAAGQGASNTTLSAIVLVALLFAMVHTYRTREESEPPRWMGKLSAATPRFSFRLGFLLMGFFPTDILTSVAVGSYLAARDAPLTDAVPFVLLTLFVLALPSLVLVAFGERAETFLPKARDWMNENAWVVNELVIVFFILMSLNNLLG
ncbi:Sap, sulfolipid-1-addressing protein [Natronoarchaeum philippinense]|uniref:Sap, sulfolipid-1-addressing protein n=1 Tax=Natronoarchaeum philippinense TaxID=558529 RepID=A0A285N5J5_NATPI|nr:GAP family protein [Natronoarchaeum philippinense]SNZ02991.1 Sap, sulfolipid-1-addressing protein [Natronoarchaeum philippinense]